MNSQNPVQIAHPFGSDEHVQPDSPLSGEVKRGGTIHLGPDRRADLREVYFVHAVTLNLIKIGVANSAIQRFSALRTQSPDVLELLGVVSCGRDGIVEQMTHGKFAHLRSHGEWFRVAPELMNHIAEVAGPPRGPKRLSLLERRMLSQQRRDKRRLSLQRRRIANGLSA